MAPGQQLMSDSYEEVSSEVAANMLEPSRAFTPLIDAKAASGLLGVPHTWLLAQAREGRIPHHRLGRYVRFNPDDLKERLGQTRSGAGALR